MRSIRDNALTLVFGALFVMALAGQAVAGYLDNNERQSQHGMPTTTWLEYIASPDFWSRTLQNWQSEFLAVGAMIALSIYLRQRGSSESKPVGAPHHVTSMSSD